MSIEYEATFTNIDKDEMRKKLKAGGAKLIKPEFLQKRVVFHLPKNHELRDEWAWARVRDEGDKITMSIKIYDGAKIDNQKEVCLEVDDFNEAVSFLETLGCEQKSYQETKREIWELDGVEISIDEWPFLEPLVEIEGKSEIEVKQVTEKLGFDWSKARFCATGAFYCEKYGLAEEVINNQTPKIVFDMKNPFIP